VLEFQRSGFVPWQTSSATISRKVILLIERCLFTTELCLIVSELLCLIQLQLGSAKIMVFLKEESPVLDYNNPNIL